MKTRNVFLFALALSPGLAVAGQDDISRDDSPSPKPLTVEQIKRRIQVKGEIFVLDASGKRVEYVGNESRAWKSADGSGRLEINWGNSSRLHKPIHLPMTWTVRDDGSLLARIRQFESMKDGPTKPVYGKLLGEKEFEVRNFEPITWRSAADPEKNVVIRLTPTIGESDEPVELDGMPLAGREVVITDNRGRVWNERVTMGGKYVSIGGHLGQLALSYFPFPGGEAVGVADGHRIELKLPEKLTVTLVSELPFLPGGSRTRVYALYNADKRTKSFNHTRINATDNLKRFTDGL
jgi:hypothetical protein